MLNLLFYVHCHVRHSAPSDSYGPAVRYLLDMYKLSASNVSATGPHSRLLKGQVPCLCLSPCFPVSADRQHLSYDGCLEVREEIIRTVLCCIVY